MASMTTPTTLTTLRTTMGLVAFGWLLGATLSGCATKVAAQESEPAPMAETPEGAGPVDRFAEVEAPSTGADVNASSPGAQGPGEKGPNAKGPDEETRKLIEEYKSLALKNDCSRGKRDMAGTWRFVGDTRVPDYASEIRIEGTRYRETISGRPDGKQLDATLEGEIRCVFKNRVLVQIDKVTPEGAYDNNSGDLYPCDVLSDMDPKTDRMLIICYFDWDLRTSRGMEFEYERVEGK